METLLPDQNPLAPMVGSARNLFGECGLGTTDAKMNVDESLFSRISTLSGTFTIKDVGLRNSGLFADSASDAKKNIREDGASNPEFFCDPATPSKDLSSQTPLPPFYHFRLPPPPPPSSVIPRQETNLKLLDGSFSKTCSDVVNVDAIHADVVNSGSFNLTSFPSPSCEESRETNFKLQNCLSAPSTIPPFKGKGKASRLFSQEKRRATLHNPSVPESWISPQSALLTVLTRDLYPPPSELVAPPPKQADLEKYYAVFLPKNLSDDYAKGVVDDKASSIPSLLGRSASTESLHKDRLLPLLDDFFDCGDLDFSCKKTFRHSSSSDDSWDDCPRRSFSKDVNGVGFYLASGSPPGSRIGRSKMTEDRWVPYFGDPKDAQGHLPLSLFPFSDSSSPSLALRQNQTQSSSLPRPDPSNIKRSRSAEPTKTDQRNEKAKKYLRVRFADSEGKDLAKSKDFRKTDDLKIPTRVLEPLRSGIERGLPAVGVRHFYPKNFTQNIHTEDEALTLVKQKKVVLREVDISPDLVIGTVVVGNVSSQHKKNVFVRCTYNDWNSFLDIPAGHLSSDDSASTSSFSFAVGVPRDFVKGDKLEFAVGYTGMGRIYWDNNEGNNYIIECFARQCPLHSEDRSWISFI